MTVTCKGCGREVTCQEGYIVCYKKRLGILNIKSHFCSDCYSKKFIKPIGDENRKLTSQFFEIKSKDIFHFVGGTYKSWWSACNGGQLKVDGYNGADPSMLLNELEIATEDGRIVKKNNKGEYQDYLIEVKIKVTKLDNIKND